MNLGEFQTGVKRYGFDDTDPLTIWINAAIHEFEQAAEWPFLEGTSTISGAVGVSTLTLPSDFVHPYTLRDLTEEKSLEYYDPRKFDREFEDPTDSGKPEVFTVWAGSIILWRVPDASTSFSLKYRKSITDLVNTSDELSAIPKRHHYTIIRGAAYIALQAENEEERAITAQGQWEADLAKAIEFYSLRQYGEMGAVEDVMGYGS